MFIVLRALALNTLMLLKLLVFGFFLNLELVCDVELLLNSRFVPWITLSWGCRGLRNTLF